MRGIKLSTFMAAGIFFGLIMGIASTSIGSGLFDYDKDIGLVIKQKDGLCLSIGNPDIPPGTPVTLIGFPFSGNLHRLAVARTGRKVGACNIGGAKATDTAYRLNMDPAHSLSQKHTYDMAVRTPLDQFQNRSGPFGADLNKDGIQDQFRTCASGEGLHLTVWNGEPLKSRKMWHRYLYLGYDLESNCVEADWTD